MTRKPKKEVKKAELYTTTGDIRLVKPSDGKHFTYDELSQFVKGRVEIVPLPSGRVIAVNEEGKLINLEVNEKASLEWLREYPLDKYSYNNDGTICGDALFTDSCLIR